MKSLSAFVLAALAFATLAVAAPIIREPGAIYLSDFGQKPLKLKVLNNAVPCFFDVAMTRFAGTLRFPQVVQVEAVTDTACRIRGNAQQGGVAAWVAYDQLEALPDGLLVNLKKSEERRHIVDALIAKNEVAIGMTTDEVSQARGTPTKTSVKQTGKGQTGRWEYIEVEQVQHFNYLRDPVTGQPTASSPTSPRRRRARPWSSSRTAWSVPWRKASNGAARR